MKIDGFEEVRGIVNNSKSVGKGMVEAPWADGGEVWLIAIVYLDIALTGVGGHKIFSRMHRQHHFFWT